MTPEDAKKLFLEQLEAIDHAIRFVCRRASLRDHDAEDFASTVKLKLIDHDYAVIRKHDGRSSFRGYIGVVVQRLLLDHRNAEWGKWHASAEAKRIGEPAITIEAMLHRDGHTIEEILPTLLRRWPELTREKIDGIVRALPPRSARPRTVELDLAAETVGDDATTVHDAAFEADRNAVSQRASAIVRETMKEFEERDRLIVRLHYEGMSVADIARVLCIEQKPLYRRQKRALARLRARLEAAGIDAEDAKEWLSSRSADLDFGFDGGTGDPRPSNDQEES
ncbi:MAG TPA: sigma-70 family RNA polymerase sigma factor [Thermoanaerobaculia bacterium]|nr:sigma-70 family RNA polymerase sigma factor [Thermoanaerobaculia bacterium]